MGGLVENDEPHHKQQRPFFFGFHSYFQQKHDICRREDLFFLVFTDNFSDNTTSVNIDF